MIILIVNFSQEGIQAKNRILNKYTLDSDCVSPATCMSDQVINSYIYEKHDISPEQIILIRCAH